MRSFSEGYWALDFSLGGLYGKLPKIGRLDTNPKIVGLPLQGHLQTGPPSHRNSHIGAIWAL